MKDKKEFIEETEEQKSARWNKQSKLARSFAKQCGVNLKKVADERQRIAESKRNRRYY